MGNCDGDEKMRIVMKVSGQNCDGNEKSDGDKWRE